MFDAFKITQKISHKKKTDVVQEVFLLSLLRKGKGSFPTKHLGRVSAGMAPVFVPFACSVVAFVSSRNYSVSSRKMTQCSAAALQSLPSLLDKGGEELTLSATKSNLQGKRVALFFSAGWCPMVRVVAFQVGGG